MKKIKIVRNDKKITKYKLGNITFFSKEKTQNRKKIKFFGLSIFKFIKKEKSNGQIVKKMYIANIPFAKIKETKTKKKLYILGVAVFVRKTKKIHYKYYLLGIKVCKKVMPNIQVTDLRNAVKVKHREKLVFPKFDNPVVSIIIPVYNQYEYTRQCLKSILISEDLTPYEVIIADDNSTDETKNIRRYVSNIKVSRNETNLGYIKNCNKASELASGKYIYFLNNDTVVQKNWLAELVRVFDLKKDAGVVGSKIYSKDYALQECGVLMFADEFYNRFNDDPTDSRYMYLKQVDYVSGCSMLTPKKLFDEIGGFDILFSPAYCDDLDYCLEALKRGYKTYVQPKSQIVHFGSVSYNEKSNDLMTRNNELLRTKWKNYFENRIPYKPYMSSSASTRSARMLIVDDKLPQFDKHAGGKTIFQFCQMFVKMGLDVKFCPLFGIKEEPYYSILSDMGIEVIDQKDVKQWIEDNYSQLDYLLLSRPQVAENFLIKQIISRGVKVLYYGHDLHHLRMQREREITQNHDNDQEIEDLRLIEELTIKYVNWAYYPSITEEKYIKEKFGLSNVSTVPPYLYDTSTMPENKAFGKSPNILFVGSSHGPNKDGLLWFINEIFPKVTKEIPQIVFNIVGSHVDKEIDSVCSKNRNINLLGYQTEKELNEIYAHTMLTVSPLRYGAGIKGKVIDSMYHSTPVVTTDVGAEGIDLSYGNIYVGNTAEEFARHIIDLCANKKITDKEANGFKNFINDNYSFDKAIHIFSKQIDSQEKQNI